MAETYYFSHDYNTRSDIKIKRLIKKFGAVGYGVYWMIVEDLYNNDNSLPLDFEALSYDLRIDEELVKSIVSDFELFVVKDNYFGSLSIQKRLDKRLKRSKVASENAKKRWNNATAMPSHSKSNAIKKSKEEESIIISNETLLKNCISNKKWLSLISVDYNNNENEVIFLLNKFQKHLMNNDDEKENMKEFKRHFNNWRKKQPKKDKISKPNYY